MAIPYFFVKEAPLPEELRPAGGFDVDDLVYDFVGIRYAKLGLSPKTLTNFHIEKVPEYTDEQKVKIRASFNDPNYYLKMQFYDGFSEIMRPSVEFGVREFFASNCTSRQVDVYKRRNIHQQIQISDEDLLMHITGETGEHALMKKPMPENLLFYADDAIHNLVASPAEVLISMDKPWNLDPALRSQLDGRKVYWVADGDLIAINEIVYDLCRERVRQIRS